MQGTHEYTADERNASILININGQMVPRGEASVSVFDSGFVLGDGVWEGLRVEAGTVLFLEQHLQRLFEGMKTLDFEPDFFRAELGGEDGEFIEVAAEALVAALVVPDSDDVVSGLETSYDASDLRTVDVKGRIVPGTNHCQVVPASGQTIHAIAR